MDSPTESAAPTLGAPAQLTPPASSQGQGVDAIVDTFYDASTVPPELMGTYKAFQKAFTQKSMGIAADKKKIEEYNRFMASAKENPEAAINTLAKQLGINLASGSNGTTAAPPNSPDLSKWEPQNWKEVLDTLTPEVRKQVSEELMGKMKPVFDDLKKTKSESYKKQLDAIDPEWKTYETDMVELLGTHPTLANDPEKLYRLAVPKEILIARATQAALQKLKTQAEASHKPPPASSAKVADKPKKGINMQEAWEMAKKKIQS